MEKINLKSNTPEALVLQHVLKKAGPKARKMTNGNMVDVLFVVGREEVSFTEVVQAFAASLDEQARAKAEEMISEAGLEPALTALREARLGIRKALHDCRPKADV